jgi:hypothetical protein
MKKIALVVAALVSWLWWTRAPAPEELKPAAHENAGRITWLKSADVSSTKDLKFKSMPGAYSVVLVHNEKCPSCVQLQPRLERMIAVRTDVEVIAINLPTAPADCYGGLNSEQWDRCEPLHAAVKAEFKRLGVCHTPFVGIFDPKGKAIAVDSCSASDGLQYINRWLRAEGV